MNGAADANWLTHFLSVMGLGNKMKLKLRLLPKKSETEWLLAFQNEIQTQKGFKKCLFIMTCIHNMQIFREIPFVKPQNDT